MSLKWGSNIKLRITCSAFCTIFSLGFPMSRGRVSPGLLALGMCFKRAGVNKYLPSFMLVEVLTNQFSFILSSVSFVDPLVIFPGLLLIRE